MLLPARLVTEWHGILLPAPCWPGQEPEEIDASGRPWFDCDAFDFECPRSDYEHLCARPVGAFLHDVGGVADAALVISNGSDSFAWWPEASAILANYGGGLVPKLADCSAPEELFDWTVNDSGFVLMCSADYPAFGGVVESLAIDIAPGTYRVQYSVLEGYVHVYQLEARTATDTPVTATRPPT
jgi:hypothetical protein